MKKPITVIGTIVGLITLVFGIVALFSPRLPAVPLLFVAVVCFVHFCPPFVAWFLKRPISKSFFDDFIKERSMTRKNKIKTLGLSTVIVVVFCFLCQSVCGKIAIVILLAVEYYYFYFMVWVKIEDGHGLSDEDAAEDHKDA